MSDWQKTTCAFCASNCGLEVQTVDHRITKVRPDKDSPRSQGYACRKGLAIAHFQDHPDRLTHPLKRVGDGFERISWEQAYREIAAGLKEVVNTHGPRSLAFMGGLGLGSHFGGPFFGSLLRGLGSKYHYHPLAQELTGKFWVQGEAYGTQGVGATPDEEHADAIVVWGANRWRSHHMNRARPFLKEIRKDPNRTLIVVDPCHTETAQRADVHLALRPGTDALLLESMISILLEEGIYDKTYVEQNTIGFEEVSRLLEGHDVRAALEVCRLDEAEVRRITRLLAASKCCFDEDLGILMSRNSTINSYLLMILVNLLGRVGQQGGNVFRGGMGLGGGAPLSLDDPENWSTVETGYKAIMNFYPPNVLPEEIMGESPERIRALVVSNSNPLRSYADTKAYQEAFERLDLLVTSDIAMSETARLSDYVLPAKSAYEMWGGTFWGFAYPEYYFHLRRPVCEPLGEQKEDAEIWSELADALGLIPEYPPELDQLASTNRLQYAITLITWVTSHPENAPMMPHIVAKTLGKALGSPALALAWTMLMQYGQSGGDRLERAGYTPSPALGEELFQKLRGTPGDILMAVQDVENNLADGIAHEDGKVHLHIPRLDDWMAEITPAAELERMESTGYPLVLAAGERTDYNATTRMRNKDWMGDEQPCTLKMHPEDAKELGIDTGMKVLVETERGSLEIEVQVSESPSPCRGMVFMPHGFGLEHCGQVRGVNVNYLTSSRHRDRFAGTPLHKSVPCRVSPL